MRNSPMAGRLALTGYLYSYEDLGISRGNIPGCELSSRCYEQDDDSSTWWILSTAVPIAVQAHPVMEVPWLHIA